MIRILGKTIILAVIMLCHINTAVCEEVAANPFRYVNLENAGILASKCFGEAGGIETLETLVKNGIVTANGLPFRIDLESGGCLVTGLGRTIERGTGKHGVPGIVPPEAIRRMEADMKQALRSRETLRLETIRGVRGAIRNKEIEVGAALDEPAREAQTSGTRNAFADDEFEA